MRKRQNVLFVDSGWLARLNTGVPYVEEDEGGEMNCVPGWNNERRGVKGVQCRKQ